MGRTRAGQVTLFVIIGIVLLLVVGLSLIIFKPEQPAQTGSVNSQPIVTYVDSCLYEVAKEGLLIAGRQGGYISLAGRTYNEEMPWIGNTFVDGPEHVPYWHHAEACEDPYGCIRSEAPPLCKDEQACVVPSGGENSIEAQLEQYVEENLNECLAGFETLTDLYTIEEQDEPTVDIMFTTEDVVARLALPLKVEDQQSGDIGEISRFETSLDIDFEEIYRLARDVLYVEQDASFVEANALQFLAVYQGDPPNPPPFNDAEFLTANKYWMRSEVEEQLEKQILPYLNFMQVVNAQAGYAPILNTGINESDPYSTYARGLFGQAQINLGMNKSYPDLGVSFLYPYSPIFLNINNREVLKGEKLKTGNFFLKIIGFLMTKYEFKYDIAFPVIVTLHDKTAFGGEGYEFLFGIEGNIINNKPLREETKPLATMSTAYRVDPSDPQHHVKSTISLTVTDRHTGEALPNTAVAYECGWRFDLGATDENGRWSGTLPYCAMGGMLVADGGLDYLSEGVPFNNTLDNRDEEFSLALWPLKKKEMTVLKRSFHDIANYTAGNCQLDECRSQLAWDEYLTYEYNFDANGSVNYDETDTNGTTATNMTIPYSQYAVIMLQRENAAFFQEPVPLVGTVMIGQDLESVAMGYRLQKGQLDEMLADDALTQEQYDIAVAQLQNYTDTEVTLHRFQELNLAPGKYVVQEFLFYNGELHIPKEKRKEGPFWHRATITIPAKNFTTWLQGGAEFVGENTVEFTEQDIYGDNSLVFYVLEQPLPLTWKKIEKYKAPADYQETDPADKYKELALPRFEEIDDKENWPEPATATAGAEE